MIFLSYKIQKAKPKILLLRNYGGMALECLNQDAWNLNWLAVIDGVTINDKVKGFNRTLTLLYDIDANIN